MCRVFQVTIEASVRVTEEVVAESEDEAGDIAMSTYTLDGATILDEEVIEIEEVTAYRAPATL